MPHIFRNSTFAIALFVSAAPLLAVHADAKTSTFMQECSAKWKAAKAAKTVPDGTKWTDFMKTECGAGADQATTPAPPPVKAAATKKVKAATTPTPTKQATTAPAGDSFMQKCGGTWKSMKDAGSVPAGLTWKAFVKQSCAVDASATVNASADENAVPAEPTDANYANIEVKTVDKNGKPFTPGQIAAHQRIKECAGEWHAAKSAGSLPTGEKWPNFWSTCNTRLKTQG
jgi:hypothetical protein